MAGGKITQKEIKRDEFARTIGGLTVAVEKNYRSLGIAVGALLILVVAVISGVRYSSSQRKASILSLAAVQKAEAAPVTSGAIPGAGVYTTPKQKYEEVVRLADVVLTQYPSSSAARWATYYKALAQKELGAYQDALTVVEPLTTLQGEEFLACSARMLKGQIQEAHGDLAAAAETYANLAASAPERFPVDVVLASQARVLEAKGDTEGAAQIHRRLMQEFPNSPFAGQNVRPGRS